MAERFAPRRPKVVVFKDRVVIAKEPFRQEIDMASLDPSALRAAVRLAVRRASGRLGLRTITLALPDDLFLERAVAVPAQLLPELDAAMRAELQARTPFSADEVVAGHAVAEMDGGVVKVQQLVLKRSWLLRELDRVGLAATQVAWVERNGAGQQRIRLSLAEPARQPRAPLLGLSAAWLWGLAGLLALTAAAVELHWQHRRMAALEAEQLALRPRAAQATQMVLARRADVEQLSVLHHRRRQPDARDLLDELTRLLPDSAWLSELRFNARDVVLTGYAQAAASLIPQISRSAMFDQARLAGPIVMDAGQGRERVSIALARREAAVAAARR
jgi:general secretion pathway protein L